MGLFSFFKKNGTPVIMEEQEKVGVPKDLFVEESEPMETSQLPSSSRNQTDLNAIYEFLQQDYETRGYSDALTNAEESYKRDNIELIHLDLSILIEKARSHYENLISQLDLHIQTRTRSGLVDLVEELKSRRETIQQGLIKIKEIADGITNKSGLSQRAVLSYTRGFLRGLTAITQSKILN